MVFGLKDFLVDLHGRSQICNIDGGSLGREGQRATVSPGGLGLLREGGRDASLLPLTATSSSQVREEMDDEGGRRIQLHTPVHHFANYRPTETIIEAEIAPYECST